MKYILFFLSYIRSFFTKSASPIILNNYSIINSTDTIEKFTHSHEKYCYFCECTDSNKFKTEPHLTPELLGKNDNTYNYECDDCNAFFSKEYENEFSRYVQPFIIASQVKNGSNKHPKYKPHSTSGFSIQFDKNSLLFNAYDKKSKLLQIDENTKTSTIEIPRVPFYPYKVYKSLVKIGISLLPKEDLKNYETTIKWLRYPEENIQGD